MLNSFVPYKLQGLDVVAGMGGFHFNSNATLKNLYILILFAHFEVLTHVLGPGSTQASGRSQPRYIVTIKIKAAPVAQPRLEMSISD